MNEQAVFYSVSSQARGNFDYAMGDVSRLLKFHDVETKRRRGRPSPDIEVFKRAGVVLAVTAWESFIEDTVTETFTVRLKAARTPRDVQGTFNSVADAWLSRSNRRPPDLAAWTGDAWKIVLRDQLSREVGDLNTPNAANVARLSKRYLGRDLTTEWNWPGTRPATTRIRLDVLIELRGRLIHRTKAFVETRASVKRKDLVNASALVNRLVQRTEEALGVQPKEYGRDMGLAPSPSVESAG